MRWWAATVLFPLLITTSPVVSAERSGGLTRQEVYVEQFVNDYDKLKAEGYRPNSDLPAIKFDLPFDWGNNRFNDSNWMLSLHMWRVMNPIIARWYETKDNSILAELFPYIDDWWSWHAENKPNRYSWYDMVTGVRALRLAFIAERIQAGDLLLSDEQLKTLSEVANAHALFLKQPENVPSNNHGIFASVGLRRLCLKMPQLTECGNAMEVSEKDMRRVLSSQFTDEGIQREHSPGYHLWVSNILADLGVADLFKEIPDISTMIDRSKENDGWLVFPTGEAARVGDTWVRGKPLKTMQNERCLDGGANCFAVGDFTKSGWAIIRSDPNLPLERQSMLFVTGMSQSLTHKHADDLSFELMEGGERFLIDTGQYSFGLTSKEAKEMRKYFESASGHNTIDLPEGIGKRDTKPYGSALEPVIVDGDAFVIKGTAPGRGGKFDQKRTLEYRPGTYLVIRDDLKSDEPRDYISRLHFEAGVDVFADGDEFVARKGQVSAHLKLVTVGCQIRHGKGQKSPLFGWKSVGRRDVVPTSSLAASCPGQDREIVWRISFNLESSDKAVPFPAR